MASKTQSTNVTQQKKVYVKSETAFQQMQVNGQLEAHTEYYTPDDSDAVFMPVGAIFSSAIPQTDARVHILDGSTISQTGMYAAFATLLKTLVSSGYAISCTQAQFNSDVSTYGQCGKFVIDNSAGTIRLPKITKFVEGLTSLTNIGKSFSAGLPNIKGKFQKDTILVGSPDLATGPFSLYHSQNWNVAGGGGTNPIHEVTFDANRANSIYKDDVTTVQPQSTSYPYYIVLAGGYKSTQQVNIDNIASDFGILQNQFNNFHLYQHSIMLCTGDFRICFNIMTNSPTAFTTTSLDKYLYDNGFNSNNRDNTFGWYPCSGGTRAGGASFVGISSDVSGTDGAFIAMYTYYNQAVSISVFTPTSIWDKVTKIF